MEILVVNSCERAPAGDWITDCLHGTPFNITVIEKEELVGGFDARGFGRVYLSGSERSVFEDADWILAQLRFIRSVAAEGIPLMGVCFGHQMIVRALHGKEALTRRAVPEVGWPDVFLGGHWLFEGVRSPTPAFNFHFDQVIPNSVKGLQVIARSDECPVQAFVHEELPLAGVQFHPEIKPADGAKEIQDRAPLLGAFGLDSEEILSANPDGRRTYLPRVIENFARNTF